MGQCSKQIGEKGVNRKDLDEKGEKPTDYHHLIEQQAILPKAKNQSEDTPALSLKPQDIQEACAEKLQRFTQKLQAETQLSQEINRSRQRGMDFGP